MQPTKNIIFDLGGVLMDIDFSLTHRAFEQLGVHNFAELYNQYHADTFFSDFEKGKIEKEIFFDHIRRICHCDLSNHAIRDAWNALLIGFPEERIRWLLQVREKYRIFLFSNTNIIHYESFSALFKEAFGMELNSCFLKAYYSHEMGMRKPDADGYLTILREQQLNPAETIFIDDTRKNTEAAKELGLQTIHLQLPATVTTLSL